METVVTATVLVDSFDGYSDLWPSFFAVFGKQWPTCRYDVKLVSNHRTFDGVDTITVGDETCWTERTLRAVRRVETDYVILLLEDYLFGAPVSDEAIEEALAFMQEKDAKYLRLTNIPKSRFHKGDGFFPLYADEEYAVNLQASIWRRDFLLEALETYPGNAWEFEIGFLRAAVGAEHAPLKGCFGMSEDPLHVRNGVLKGKWFPGELRYFAKRGIDISWQERGKLSFAQNAKYRLSVGLKSLLSYKMRKRIKAILKKLGVKFVSDL